MDEIFIKSDLVYEKHDGSLIGFVNISNVNNQLLEFEAMIEKGNPCPSLASSMMVFMVKELLHKFDYPYAQFACGNLSGDLIFDPIWEAVARLERRGFLYWHCVAMVLLQIESFGNCTVKGMNCYTKYLTFMLLMKRGFCTLSQTPSSSQNNKEQLV